MTELATRDPLRLPDFDTLYRDQWWPMIRLAQGWVDDVSSAEDVVQDAFAGLYRRQRRLRDQRAAVGYLRASVVNGARSALRRRRTVRAKLGWLLAEDAPAADEPALRSAEQEQARRLLAALAPPAARGTDAAFPGRPDRHRDRRGDVDVTGQCPIRRQPGAGHPARDLPGRALMTDPDTFAALLNSSVDLELGGPRPAPTFRPTEPAGLTRWRGPLLAAVAVAAVSAGTVVAIQHEVAAPVRPAAGTAPVLTPSPSATPTSPVDLTRYPEAAAVPGVSVRALTAQEEDERGGHLEVIPPPGSGAVTPGIDYPVTVRYTATADKKQTAVMSVAFDKVASASCPPSFKMHAGHVYQFTCTVRVLAGLRGTSTVRLLGLGADSGFTYTVNLRKPTRPEPAGCG